ARPDNGPPMVGRALAAAHPGFCRLRGDRFIREDTDPNLSTSFELMGDGPARGLDLPAVDPCMTYRLQPELSKAHVVAGASDSPAPPSVLLSEFDPLWLKHSPLLARGPRAGGSRRLA